MDDLSQLKPLLMKIGLVAVAAGIVLIVWRHLMQWYYREHERGTVRKAAQVATEEAGEEDDTIPLAPLGARSNVKRWKVCGVEKASGNDATWYIEAESRANAKVKAELKGMIVTAVERAPGSS